MLFYRISGREFMFRSSVGIDLTSNIVIQAQNAFVIQISNSHGLSPLRDYLPLAFRPSSTSGGRSVILLLQYDPDDEDQSGDDANLNPQVSCPFPALHFPFTVQPGLPLLISSIMACRNLTMWSGLAPMAANFSTVSTMIGIILAVRSNRAVASR